MYSFQLIHFTLWCAVCAVKVTGQPPAFVPQPRPTLSPESDRSRDPLFDRLLTPLDLIEYVLAASNVTVEDSSTELKLVKGSTESIQRLLRIPLVRPSQLPASEAYYVQVQIGLKAASPSSSPMLYLSDNRNAVGFVLPSSLEDTTAVCCGTEGEETFPNGLTQARIFGGTTIEGPTQPGGSPNNTNNSGRSSGNAAGGENSRRRRHTDDKDNAEDDNSITDEGGEGDGGTAGNISRKLRDARSTHDEDGGSKSSDDSDSDSDSDSYDSDGESDDSDSDSDESDGESGVSIEGVTPLPQLASDSSGTPSAPTNPSNTALPHSTRLLFKPRNSWGSCTVMQASGAASAAMFSLPINPENGLFLDMYLGSQEQQTGITHMLIELVLEVNPVI